MDYTAHLNDACPAEIVQLVEATSMGQFPENRLASKALRSLGGYPCAEAVILALTPRLTSSTHPQVLQDYFNGLRTYVPAIDAQKAADIREAVARIGSLNEAPMAAYGALRHHKIDIRDMLPPDPAPNWGFSHPSDPDAAAWHRALYLASFDDLEAYDAIRAKLDATLGGNDVYILLKSLNDLRTPKARDIIAGYRADTRTTDGPNGPGLAVGALVASLN